MADFLSPVHALNQLIRINRKAALPLVAGLAALAAAAIALTWGVDIATMGLMALYILALGFLLLTLGATLKDPIISRVLGWFVTLLIIATISCFFVSAVFRAQGVIKPTYCLVRIFERCEDVEASVAARNTPFVAALPRVPGPATVTPGRYQVSIKFAGLVTDESVSALSYDLATAGWHVAGERLRDAQGVNEVRFAGDADRAAAETLARAAIAANIIPSAVPVRQVSTIAPGTLEIWLSR